MAIEEQRYHAIFDKDHYTLDDTGKKAVSGLIYIPNGYVGVLSLYNMIQKEAEIETVNGKRFFVFKDCIAINKVSFGKMDDIEFKKKRCGEYISYLEEIRKALAGVPKRVSPVMVDCCPQTITPGNNIAILTVPGFYELETTDLDQIDDLLVDLIIYPADQAVVIPDRFKIGVQK